MRHLAGWLLLILFCGNALASSPAFEDVSLAEWSEVTEIERRAKAGGLAGYEAASGTWLLAPDGRIAIVFLRDEDEDGEGARSAMLGRYELQGSWLTVELGGSAIDLASLSKEQRAEYEEWQAASLAAKDAAQAATAPHEAGARAGPDPAADTESEIDAEAAAQAEAELEAIRRPRYLRVAYRGGELLVREQFLPMAANQWNGKEPLELYAEAWRLPAGAAPKDGEHTFKIEDPLRAGLPYELARLLRADAIEARVAEVLETAETLEWQRQRAKVHLLLDRGQHAGLYVGMSLRGLPPDEEFSGEIVSATADQSRLELQVERFAPGDAVALPTPGVRFTTRGERGACAIDTSVALRAKVATVATPAELVQWDEEGYAWFELQLDQGAAQGLAVGDRLHAENDETDGEGRVLSVASRHATVQWRAQRYSKTAKLQLPAAGDALVTPAWQRAEWDVFGDATQH